MNLFLECPFQELLNDTICHVEANNELCDYDGGDCCPGDYCHHNVTLFELFTPDCGWLFQFFMNIKLSCILEKYLMFRMWFDSFSWGSTLPGYHK